jgi:hypothetical protein
MSLINPIDLNELKIEKKLLFSIAYSVNAEAAIPVYKNSITIYSELEHVIEDIQYLQGLYPERKYIICSDLIRE